jgi:hypothetical protein
MEEYLTVDELSSKIKYSKQSVYNLIYKKIFILGKHYFKPTPKKILFKWSEVQTWLERPLELNREIPANESVDQDVCDKKSQGQSVKDTPDSSINI